MKLLAFITIQFVFIQFIYAQNNMDTLLKRASVTEVWQPVPVVVTPGNSPMDAPSDAIVLFNGSNMDAWQSERGGEPAWKLENDAMTVAPGKGGIKTKQDFSSMQIHLEWKEPETNGEGQDRGNSGILIQEQYEVQILDNYNSVTYSNGQAGSIYKQSIPLVNACKKPGEWQTYDIIWNAPKFSNDTLVSPATITVLQNGILVQNNYTLKGKTMWIGQPYYEPHGAKPILLQDHGHLVSFRNIWVRPL